MDVVAQKVRPDGTLAWHEGRVSIEVASSDRPERRPLLVSDGEGGAIVTYRVEVAGDRHALFAQRISRHGELLWNQGERGVLVCSAAVDGGPEAVSVAADGMGGLYVAFEVRPDAARPELVDVAVQRVSAAGALLWGTAGEDGPPPPVLASASPYADRRPVLLPDGQGGVVVAWEGGSAEGDLDVLAQRLDGEGHVLWNEGNHPSPVAFTFLAEHGPRIVERHPDRVLVLFEVEKDNGLSAVACQALSLETGKALYGGGKFPIAVMDAGDVDIHYLLRARENAEER